MGLPNPVYLLLLLCCSVSSPSVASHAPGMQHLLRVEARPATASACQEPRSGP
jgi:hypothetical protein